MDTQQNDFAPGEGCGFLALIVLSVVLVLVINFWQWFLAAGLAALLFYAVANAVLQENHRQLKDLVATADRRTRHEACRVSQDPSRVPEKFGIIQAITLLDSRQLPSRIINVQCLLIDPSGSHLRPEETWISLSPPLEPQLLRSATGVANWLKGSGLVLLDDLSVEAKATRAAMECLRELTWTSEALGTLGELRTSVNDTLVKARGNELLEPSIPQLQQALNAYEQEQRKLEQAYRNAGEMLRKLHDFLSVPDRVRPILNFDIDQLFDPQRFLALEQSFAEVVLLNDAFRQLSKDALA